MMIPRTAGPIRVLLADDDEDDCFLIGRALAAISVDSEFRTVHDGEALLTLMRDRNDTGSERLEPWPNLVLLDLNMPRMDGREVLAEIKSDPLLRRIPVVVLTTSKAHTDVLRCYDLGANSYVVKARAFNVLLDDMQHLMNYWTELAMLPGG